MSDWYTIENPEVIDTPALVIYPDRVQHNLGVLKSFVKDLNRLRPHIKTNKCAPVVKLMLDAGITRFKCSTIAEAEMAAETGVTDMLLAYQPVGPRVRRFIHLMQRYPGTTFACLVDNKESALALQAEASNADTQVRVYIDLNIGMNRTGIDPSPALDLAREIRSMPALILEGLHAYDGHLRDPDIAERTRKCDESFRPVDKLAEALTALTGDRPTIVAGGTPTFPIHAKRNHVQVSPGTFIFWDDGYGQVLSEQPFVFAALVVSRIISRPTPGHVSCDLGHKAIAAENPLERRVVFLNHPDLKAVSQSEEHLVLRNTGNNNQLPVGTLLYGVPHHICPTVALYDQAAVCRHHRIEDTWPIVARRRQITL